MSNFLKMFLVVFASLSLTACWEKKSEDPMDAMGEQMEEQMEDMQDAGEDLMEDAEDQMDEMAD